MKKNILLLLSLIAFVGSTSTMENNSQTPGDAAIKSHPNAWMATKIAGGATGSFVGFFGFAACMALGDLAGTVASRGTPSAARKRFELLKIVALSSPFVYGGWKGGEAISKAAWHSSWNGFERIQKFKDSINK